MSTSAIGHRLLTVFPSNPKSMVIKAGWLTITALVVYALSNLPKAAAGKALYETCMRGCEALPPGPFKAAWWVGCLAALAIPE